MMDPDWAVRRIEDRLAKLRPQPQPQETDMAKNTKPTKKTPIKPGRPLRPGVPGTKR